MMCDRLSLLTAAIAFAATFGERVEENSDDEATHEVAADLSYENTDGWAERYPDCGGSSQSPIDIGSGFSLTSISGHHGAGTLGRAIAYQDTTGTHRMKNTGRGLQLDGDFGNLTLPDGVYGLTQLQFHFPSEHSIDGKLAAGEMQLVHMRRGGNDEPSSAAVVSILLQPGSKPSETNFFSMLGFGRKLPRLHEEVPIDGFVDLSALKSSIYGHLVHYNGSLTTPPCKEGVRWYVMLQPASVTRGQIQSFKDVFPDPANNRPVQPLNGRQVAANSIYVKSEAPSAAHVSMLDFGIGIGQQESETPAKCELRKWTYSDLGSWSAFPICTTGSRQSPIDITPEACESSTPGTASLFDIMEYVAKDGAELTNTGGALQVDGPFGSINLPDGEYELKSIELHFPSEHSLDGSLGAAELELVHVRKSSGSNDDIAIISILFQEGANEKETGFFTQLGFANLPKEAGSSTPIQGAVDLSVFGAPLKGDFYHYLGSMTSPPCSERVHWYVMKTTASVTSEQISNFKCIFPDPANNRPVQPVLPGRRQVVINSISIGDEFPNATGMNEALPWTKTTARICPGDTKIEVASTEGFQIGDTVLIGEEETRAFVGFGSLILESPIANSYPVGTVVRAIARISGNSTNSTQTMTEKSENSTNSTMEEQEVSTTLSQPVPAGATELPCQDNSMFHIGDWVSIGPETRTIVAFGSIIIDRPLLFSYPAGTIIKLVMSAQAFPSSSSETNQSETNQSVSNGTISNGTK